MVVTQRFIAEKAGVSQKTISLYFKGDTRVAAKTAEKIKRVTEKYHYVPNEAAISMNSNCFHRIACVMGQDARHYGVPQLAAYINGLAKVLGKNGYSLLFEPFMLDIKNEKIINDLEFFKTLSVDGVIGIAGTYIPSVVDEKIKRLNAPTVWLNRYNVPNGVPAINFDEHQNALNIAKALWEKGYKKFAWFGPQLTGKIHHVSSKIRCETIVEYINNKGGQIKCYTNKVGERLKNGALDIIKDKPEVCICCHDEYRAVLNQQARIAGFSQLKTVHFASAWEVTEDKMDCFSFLELPELEIAEQGARYILNKIQNKKAQQYLKPLTGKLYLTENI